MDNSIFSTGLFRRRALWMVPCALLILLCGLIGYAQARPAEQAATPFIGVYPDNESIWGWFWPVGANIQITIDDPATSNNPDFQSSTIADENQRFWLNFEDQYDLKPGDVVTAGDGVNTRETIATNLEILGINIDADTVWGRAGPGSLIEVGFNDQPYQLDATADQDGNWMADFTEIYEIQTSDVGSAVEYDADGDSTGFSWHFPRFSVDSDRETLYGDDWTPGSTLLVSIYAAPGDPDPLQTYSLAAGDGDCPKCLFLDLDGQFDLQPGQSVAVSDGFYTKSLTVTRLQFTAFDFDLDTISGIAEPGIVVDVQVWPEFSDFGVDRQVFPASDGSWTADFGNPSPEDTRTLDFPRDTRANANQPDNDGDTTYIRMGNVGFQVRYDSQLISFGWQENHLITITIDNPDNGLGIDFSIQKDSHDYAYIEVHEDEFQGYDIQPGDIVTITDGTFTEQTIVAAIAVTLVDISTDQVHGVAPAGSIVDVYINDSEVTLQVTADQDGAWVADFTGVYNIDYGSQGWIEQLDVDYDSTQASWGALPCPPGDSVSGHVWLADGVTPAPGATVTIEIYDQPHFALYTINTPPDGSYSCGLPDGAYRLYASGGGFSREYYPETIFENAAAVQVKTGNPRTGVDFTLNTPQYIFDRMTFNFKEPIISEIAVRQAIAFGADRQQMIAATFPASPYQDSVFHTFHWAHTSEALIQTNYDPQMAKRILDQAGWIDQDSDGVREKDGVRLHLKYATTDQVVRHTIADIFTENMLAIGVEVKVIILPGPINQWFINYPDLSIAQFAWMDDDNNDNPLDMAFFLLQGNANNFGGYANPSADQLLNLAALFGTRAEMKPYLEHFQRVVMADLPILPLLLRIATLDRDGDGVPDANDACPDISSEDYDADQDGCLDTTQGLKDLVTRLYAAGEIKKSTRDSLLSQVNKVETQFNKGDYVKAVQELDNFITIVNDELKKKNLTQNAADQLIAYADSLKRWIDDKYIASQGTGLEKAWLPLFSISRF